MFKKFQAAYQFGKTVAKQLKGNKSKVSPDITFIKPTFPKNKIQAAVRDVKKTARSARGQMKRRSQAFDRDIQKVKSKLGQSMQKLIGEPVTKSGVSKGKDMKKFKTPSLNPKPINKATGGRVGKMGGGMMGRRMGYQAGSKKGKVPTTPKEKAFGMLSVNKGLDNNKNITFTDKIAGATGGKKKKKA